MPSALLLLRLTAFSICCLYLGVLVHAWVATGAPWFRSPTGAILARDFSALYAAAHMALEGKAADAYDPVAFGAALSALLAQPDTPVLRWLNPPILLLVLAPLSALPYDVAFMMWVVGTAAAFAIAMRFVFPAGGAVAFGLAAPSTIPNVLNGQNGFLSGALFGFGLAVIDRRPLLGGAILGAMIYKPHLALAIPVVLALGGYYRALFGSALGAAVLVLLSAAAFGGLPWQVFLGSIAGTADRFLGESNERTAMLTIYAALSSAGYPRIAVALHAVVAASAMAAAGYVWRTGAPAGHRAAAMIAAAFLTTPYAFTHDAAILVVGAAFLGRSAAAGGMPAMAVVLLIAVPVLPGVGLFIGISALGPLAAVLLIALAFKGCRMSSG